MRDEKKAIEEYIHLIPELKRWLGEAGMTHFRNIKQEHGKVNAVWVELGIPHCVHFREGMQIRNKLRELTDSKWSVNEYDNTWAEIIEECIK